MPYTINVGDPVPHFSTQDENGNSFTQEDLLGKTTILYFYPADCTPGCTKEACDFRDHFVYFQGLHAQIIGVSPDSSLSHRQFIEKYGLNFTLLADEEKAMCKLFDVWQEKKFMGRSFMGVERTTFIVNAAGIIVWVERPVLLKEHCERIKKAVQDASS